MTLQTYWDGIQQQIRILIYVGVGALGVHGAAQDAVTQIILATALFALTQIWTRVWNRKAVTVAGLEKAGDGLAASLVADAVKAKKKG